MQNGTKERLMTKQEELYGYLLEMVKGAVNFGKEQLPEVVEQMLTYDAWEYGMWFVIPLVCVTQLLLIGFPSAFASSYIDEKKSGPLSAILGILSFISVVIGIFGAILLPIKSTDSYFKIKQIENAPKYYLIEKLREGSKK